MRTLRDTAAADVQSIVIDQEKLYDEARAFAQVFMPELCNRIQHHRDELPLFTYYGLEERLARIYDRKVQMPSGGTVVIEQTEALVSIDVNSAKNRDSSDVETTALMTNLEAVATIAEQLVLRDLGGLIIIDFIDMEDRDNQRKVQLALRRGLSSDKAKIQLSPLSRFGLVEMTRQRTRPSHKLVASAECPYCVGTGSVKTAETLEIDCMREIRQMLHSRAVTRLEVVVPQDLALSILNARHKEIGELEERTDCKIVFTGDALMKAREFRLAPSFRKGERGERRERRGERHEPVRPSLLAPLMVEQAKAIQLAKELAAMTSSDLERELEADPVHVTEQPPRPAAEASPAPAERRAPTLWEEAAALRRLLFSANAPVAVGAAVSANGHAGTNGHGSGGRADLAQRDGGHRVPPRNQRRGRRRH